MKKITIPNLEKEPQYGEILLDRQNVFHGIGFDFIRLKGILEKGILSEQAAMREDLDLKRNYRGYNLNDSVSLVESPSLSGCFKFGCFGVYIKNGISFVIKNELTYKVPKGSPRYSGYQDEIFAGDKVRRENIVGVMIPDDLLNTPLTGLSLGLEKMGFDYIDDRCRKLLSDLEKETEYHSDTTVLEELIKRRQNNEKQELDLLKKDTERSEIFEAMEKEMWQHIKNAYAKKIGIDQPTFKDVLKLYLPSSMKVYNSDGFEIFL